MYGMYRDAHAGRRFLGTFLLIVGVIVLGGYAIGYLPFVVGFLVVGALTSVVAFTLFRVLG